MEPGTHGRQMSLSHGEKALLSLGNGQQAWTRLCGLPLPWPLPVSQHPQAGGGASPAPGSAGGQQEGDPAKN